MKRYKSRCVHYRSAYERTFGYCTKENHSGLYCTYVCSDFKVNKKKKIAKDKEKTCHINDYGGQCIYSRCMTDNTCNGCKYHI